MVEQYNTRVHNQGISSDEMRAVCVRLQGAPGELDDERFDVVVVRPILSYPALAHICLCRVWDYDSIGDLMGY